MHKYSIHDQQIRTRSIQQHKLDIITKDKRQIFQVLIGDQSDKFIGTDKNQIIQTAKVQHAKTPTLRTKSGNGPTRLLICRKNPENYRNKIEKIQKHAGLKNTNVEQMKTLIGKILQENIDEEDEHNQDQKQIGWKRIL
jgi:hypothetical protein